MSYLYQHRNLSHKTILQNQIKVFSGKWKLTELASNRYSWKEYKRVFFEQKKNISIQKVRDSRRNGKERNVNMWVNLKNTKCIKECDILISKHKYTNTSRYTHMHN